MGVLNLDAPKDISDLVYSIANWKWNPEHLGNFGLNLVGVLPVLGAVKNVKGVVKNADELKEEAKLLQAAAAAHWTKGVKPAAVPPLVADQRLKNHVEQLYSAVHNPKRTGDGTTMDAIRHELATGQEVGGTMHILKGEGHLKGIKKWLNENPNASPEDRAIAENLVDELGNALRGK